MSQRPPSSNCPQAALLAASGSGAGPPSFGDVLLDTEDVVATTNQDDQAGQGTGQDQYSVATLRQTLEGMPISAVRSNLAHTPGSCSLPHRATCSISQQPGASAFVTPSQLKSSSRRRSMGATDPLRPQGSRVSAGEQQQAPQWQQAAAGSEQGAGRTPAADAAGARLPSAAAVQETLAEEQEGGAEGIAYYAPTQMVILPTAVVASLHAPVVLLATAAARATLPTTAAVAQLTLAPTQAVGDALLEEEAEEEAEEGTMDSSDSVSLSQEEQEKVTATMAATAVAAALAAVAEETPAELPAAAVALPAADEEKVMVAEVAEQLVNAAAAAEGADAEAAEAMDVDSPHPSPARQLSGGNPEAATKEPPAAATRAPGGSDDSSSGSDGNSFFSEDYSSGCEGGKGVAPSLLCTAEEVLAALEEEVAALLRESPRVEGLTRGEGEEGVSQFQSLHGLEAESQIEIDLQHRQFSEGNVVSAVRVFAVGDTVKTYLSAPLNREQVERVSARTKTNLQRAIWRSFRQHGLVASFTLEAAANASDAGPAAATPQGAAAEEQEEWGEGLLPALDPHEDARLARYLCSASLVAQRLQQLEQEGELKAVGREQRRKPCPKGQRSQQRSPHRVGGSADTAAAGATAAGATPPVPRSTARQRWPPVTEADPGAAAVPGAAGAAPAAAAAAAAGEVAAAAAAPGDSQAHGVAALDVDPTQAGAAMLTAAAAAAAAVVCATADGPSQLDVVITQGGMSTLAAASAMVALPGAPPLAPPSEQQRRRHVAAAGVPLLSPAADGASQLEVEPSMWQAEPVALEAAVAAGAATVAAAPAQPAAAVAAMPAATATALVTAPAIGGRQQAGTAATGALSPLAARWRHAAGGAQHGPFDLLQASQGRQPPQPAPGSAAVAAVDGSQPPHGKGVQLRSSWLLGGLTIAKERRWQAQQQSPQQEHAPAPAGSPPSPAILVEDHTPSGMHPPASLLTILAEEQPEAVTPHGGSAGGLGAGKQSRVPETPPEDGPILPPFPGLGSEPAGGHPQQQAAPPQQPLEARQQQEVATAAAAAAAGSIEVPDTEEEQRRLKQEQVQHAAAILPAPAAAFLGGKQDAILPAGAGSSIPASGRQQLEQRSKQHSKQHSKQLEQDQAPSAAAAAAAAGIPAAKADAAAGDDGGAGGAPVGSQAVQQAMQVVGLLSSHFAGTQDQLPPMAAEPAGPAQQAEEAQAAAAPAAAAPANPPPTAAVAAAAEAAGPANQDGGTIVSSRGQRRWRQRLDMSDSEGEEEQHGPVAAVVAAKCRQYVAAAPPTKDTPKVTAMLGKRLSRRELAKQRRTSHLAAVMAPTGTRPDLGLSHAQQHLLVVPATARSLWAAADAAGASPARQARVRSSSRSLATSARKCAAGAKSPGWSPGRKPVRSPLDALHKMGGAPAMVAAPRSPPAAASPAAAAAPAALGTAARHAGAATRMPMEALISRTAATAVTAAGVEGPKKHSGLIDDAPCFVDSQLANAAAAGARAAGVAATRAAAAAAAANAAAMSPPPAWRVSAAAKATLQCKPAAKAARPAAAAARAQQGPAGAEATAAQMAAAASGGGASPSDPYRFPSSSSGGKQYSGDVGNLLPPRSRAGSGTLSLGLERRRLSAGHICAPAPGPGQRPASLVPAGQPSTHTPNVAVAEEAVLEEVVEVEVVPAGAALRRQKRRWQQEEEKAADGHAAGPGLMGTILPHSVVQTVPAAAGFEGPEMVELPADSGASSRPARSSKKPAHFSCSSAKPAATGKQQQAAGGSRRQAGHKRPAAAPAVAVRSAAAGPVPKQQEQHEAKRQRTTLKAAAAVAAAGEATPSAAAPVLDSEDQTLAEYLHTHPQKLGCSKCQYRSGGCSKCRVEAAEVLSPKAAKTTLWQQPSSAARAGTKTSTVAAAAGRRWRQHRLEQQQQQQKGRAEEEQEEEEGDGAGMAMQSLVSKQPPTEGSPTPSVRRKSGIGAASSGRCFEGLEFLVTGFNDNSSTAAADKACVMAALRKGGAVVLDDMPNPPQAFPAAARRQAAGARQLALHPAVTAVISDRKVRTPKYIYAAIRGLPIVKPEWVLACAKAKSQLPMRMDQHLLRDPVTASGDGTLPGILAGLRICLALPRHHESKLKPMGDLLRHAGAQLVQRLEEAPPGGISQPCCDLLLLNEEEWAEEGAGAGGKRAADDMLRLARRLRVPVHKREWAVEAMMDGKLPDGFGSGATTPAQPKLHAAPWGARSGSGAGSAPKATEAAPAEQPLLSVRPVAAAVSGAAAMAKVAALAAVVSPHGKKQPRAAAGEQQQQQSWQPQQTPSAHTAVGRLCWVGEEQDPPPYMRASHVRCFYPAFAKDGECIAVGNFAEVQLAGEEVPRVVQVMALWGEGQGRMFARLRRFYRPTETPVAALGGPHHLFRSDHIDDRVPLNIVLRKCSVARLPAGGQDVAAAAVAAEEVGLHSYVCVAQLDLEVMLVGALPPSCGIPAPEVAG